MSFQIKVKLAAGKNNRLNLPNLTRNHYLVPSKITVTQKLDGVSRPARNIDVNVTTCNSCILFASKAYFDLSNELDLSNKPSLLSEGRDVVMQLTNRHKECVEFNINIEYKQNKGSLLYQSTFDTFKNVMNEVHSSGFITRLVLVFSSPRKDVKLLPVFNNTGDLEWVDGLELGESDENGTYVLDLCDPNLDNYSQYLNFLKLDVPTTKEEKELHLSVLAYGYPK